MKIDKERRKQIIDDYLDKYRYLILFDLREEFCGDKYYQFGGIDFDSDEALELLRNNNLYTINGISTELPTDNIKIIFVSLTGNSNIMSIDEDYFNQEIITCRNRKDEYIEQLINIHRKNILDNILNKNIES